MRRRSLALEKIRPFDVVSYVETLWSIPATPSVKQQLAAIRMLFGWLVVGQIAPGNPAASVCGPKYVVKVGKTPVLDGEEWRRLMDAIPEETVRDLRDRALIATLTYSFARIGAAPTGCHSFRATGITAYLRDGGSLEHAQAMAGHESPRTTQLYDRTQQQPTRDEVGRIRL